jgi:hypothetical protein
VGKATLADCFDHVNNRQTVIASSKLPIEPKQSTIVPVEIVQPPFAQSSAIVSWRSFVDFQGTSLLLISGSVSDCLIPSKSAQTSIHVYSIARGEWQEMTPKEGFYPGRVEMPDTRDQLTSPRKCGHEMAYDRATGRCVFYGGRTDGLLGEENMAVELELHQYVTAQTSWVMY